MSLSAILKNIYCYLEVIQASTTDRVKCWSKENLHNGLEWAKYCQQVYDKSKGKPYALELQKHIAALVRNPLALGDTSISMECFDGCVLKLTLNLVQNPCLSDDLLHELLNANHGTLDSFIEGCFTLNEVNMEHQLSCLLAEELGAAVEVTKDGTTCLTLKAHALLLYEHVKTVMKSTPDKSCAEQYFIEKLTNISEEPDGLAKDPKVAADVLSLQLYSVCGIAFCEKVTLSDGKQISVQFKNLQVDKNAISACFKGLSRTLFLQKWATIVQEYQASVDQDFTESHAAASLPSHVEHDGALSDKLVGNYLMIPVLQMRQPDNGIMCRTADAKHVKALKESLLMRPETRTTALLGLVDVSKKPSYEEIISSSIPVQIIGGNHTHLALKDLAKENSIFKEWPINIYWGLTTEQCLTLGNDSNVISTVSKPMTFEDYVILFRKEAVKLHSSPERMEMKLKSELRTNLAKILRIEKIQQLRNKYKVHLKVACLPQDTFKELLTTFQRWRNKELRGQPLKQDLTQYAFINVDASTSSLQLIKSLNERKITFQQFKEKLKDQGSKSNTFQSAETGKKDCDVEIDVTEMKLALEQSEQKLEKAERRANKAEWELEQLENKMYERKRKDGDNSTSQIRAIQKRLSIEKHLRREAETAHKCLQDQFNVLSNELEEKKNEIARLTGLLKRLQDELRQGAISSQPVNNKRKSDKANEPRAKRVKEKHIDEIIGIVEWSRGAIYLGRWVGPNSLQHCKKPIGYVDEDGKFTMSESEGSLQLGKGRMHTLQVLPSYVVGSLPTQLCGGCITPPDNLVQVITAYAKKKKMP